MASLILPISLPVASMVSSQRPSRNICALGFITHCTHTCWGTVGPLCKKVLEPITGFWLVQLILGRF